jgi:DNA-binding NarL/FixJ family response regulator
MKPIRKKRRTESTIGSQKRRVFIVDDHPITRMGFRALIENDPNLEVCGEADNAPLAIELMKKMEPNLAIVDIVLKTTNGIELTKHLYAERALRAGARGFLMKSESCAKLNPAIKKVLSGGIYLSEAMTSKFREQFVRTKNDAVIFSMESLSDLEIEVRNLIALGYAPRHIAHKLNQPQTIVNSICNKVRTKLGVKTISELAQRAAKWSKSWL